MRYFSSLRLIVLSVLLITACAKTNKMSKSIIGEWELVSIAGGRPIITYPTGNGSIVKFSDTNYQFLQDGILTKGGTYSIVEDTTVEASVCLVLPNDKYRNRIIYDKDVSSTKKFIQISNDTLSVISGCFAVDAGSTTNYKKR